MYHRDTTNRHTNAKSNTDTNQKATKTHLLNSNSTRHYSLPLRPTTHTGAQQRNKDTTRPLKLRPRHNTKRSFILQLNKRLFVSPAKANPTATQRRARHTKGYSPKSSHRHRRQLPGPPHRHHTRTNSTLSQANKPITKEVGFMKFFIYQHD